MPKATPHADYPYRAVLSAPEVTPPVAKAAEQITYPNFKAAVPDASKAPALHSVWAVMAAQYEQER